MELSHSLDQSNILAWCNGEIRWPKFNPEDREIELPNGERAGYGDWIIKSDYNDTFTVCKDELFQKVYIQLSKKEAAELK